MSTEKPKCPPPAPAHAQLKDLPAQPVDEKEAEGVKGGLTLIEGAGPHLLPPNPCAPDTIGSIRPGITR